MGVGPLHIPYYHTINNIDYFLIAWVAEINTRLSYYLAINMSSNLAKSYLVQSINELKKKIGRFCWQGFFLW